MPNAKVVMHKRTGSAICYGTQHHGLDYFMLWRMLHKGLKHENWSKISAS